MCKTLASSSAAVMDDAHRRHVGDTREPAGSKTEIIVFEIKEIARIEALQALERIGPEQHEAAAHERRIPDDTRFVDRIAHLQTGQPTVEMLSESPRQESPDEKIEQRRVAAA